MKQRKDLKLDGYNIDKNRYRELLYFCRQYHDKKRRLQGCYDVPPPKLDSMPRSQKTGDPTPKHAIDAVVLKADIDIVESVAIATDPIVWRQILKNVTQGISYEDMIIPCGRRQFYTLRRKFFFILNGKKR